MAQGQGTKIKKKKKSVLKRAAQSLQRAEVNRANRTRVRTAMKRLRTAITAGDATAALTSDLMVADFAALLIILATVLLPSLYKKATQKALPHWLCWLCWLLVVLGAGLILLAAFLMPLQLSGCHPEDNLWPAIVTWAAMSGGGHEFLVTLFWGLELAAAYGARWFLVEFVGDVTAYIAAHTASKFYELRQQIWKTAMKVARAVYRAKEEQESGSTQNSRFLYDKIIVVGHSLGSVIGYDVLNGLLLEDEFSKDPLKVVSRTRMFLTFGSPLDKTAFLFRTQADMCSPVREVAAAAVQPMIDAARVFISDAAERVEHEAKRAIAALHEGDLLTTQISVLKRFAKRAPVDTIALRRNVAKAVQSQDRYPFEGK